MRLNRQLKPNLLSDVLAKNYPIHLIYKTSSSTKRPGALNTIPLSPQRKNTCREMKIPFTSFLSSEASPWWLLNGSVTPIHQTNSPEMGTGSWWLNWVKRKRVDHLKASQWFQSGSHVSESPVAVLSLSEREELNEFPSTEFKSPGSQHFWAAAERSCLHFSLGLKPIYLNFNQRQL